MQTFDPLRTPSFTLFANPDYFSPVSTALRHQRYPGYRLRLAAPGFAWNHGYVQPQITTLARMAGPGIDQAGLDSVTGPITPNRATTMTLVGLRDDYHERRALTGEINGLAQQSAERRAAIRCAGSGS